MRNIWCDFKRSYTCRPDTMLSSVRKPPPQVTGISPKEGPPGTRVTLRGENLGTDARDLIGLRICGMDCLMTAEWKSPNKIIARTGQAKGKGDIIVVTRSGGVGTCTVAFRGYYIQTGPLQESAIWIDETQTYATMFGRSRATSPVTSQTHDDPLGLSDEASDTKFPEGDLLEMFPEGSGDSSLDNFVPAWYLLENHHGTSFDDLKAGLAFLKRKSSQKDEGPMAFVKANLSSFMDCYDTLAEVHSKVADDRTHNPGGCITEALEDVLLRANHAAEDLFQDVLRRKDRADATRNALGVLHRFKWLFNLPHTIDTNIKKGDYDLVITDYTRAKSLFGDTEVAVFKKVYKEVEKRIAALRTMLHRKLMELPLALEEQKKVIRYLVHLETRGDPAWECLVNMQQWLSSLLLDCKDQHLTREHRQQETHNKDGSQADSIDDSESRLSTTQLGRIPSFKSGSKPPQKVLFIDHLTRLLLDTLPDLWRLGQAYFSGKLLKEVKKSKHVDTAKQGKFKQMILDIISLFCNLDRAACLPKSLEKLPPKDRETYGSWSDWKGSPVSWLPICMRYNRLQEVPAGYLMGSRLKVCAWDLTP
ncbi:Exocyst complex component 2 [Lamellibrachia satsuma]|nr:Exocyst complex component 2 [Lamellibrachia satsuma]